MAKIKLTKNELKKQKDALKMFRRYLPTLQLKKQQLQVEIASVQEKADRVMTELKSFQNRLDSWVSLYAEDFSFEDYLEVRELSVCSGNIAGVEIPIFEKVTFNVMPYDLFDTPPWVDHGIKAIQDTISLRLQHKVYQEQKRLLEAELRVTTQRVNLFEKVKIPETKMNIKKIAVYMGDQQTASVVCGKIAKKKLEEQNSASDLAENFGGNSGKGAA
ncbi:V-type ATP synthase subunit D [Candidatus Haliotispira prima]|uniref:V-type ATP synthase subunit D n=1 Tax=Candidatus Haliotispira prima TaxID=3034016 RepID=A0ABY8MGT6_9SPIO|nr:V-type ATP synthase subunit D [Candidatus Haliotispira prima]